MSYPSTHDPAFLRSLQSWLQSSPEILLLIRFSAAAGSKSFEFVGSYHELCEKLSSLPPRTCVTAFQRRYLPLRGIVDEEFISRCLASIPDDSEFLLVDLDSREIGAYSWYHFDSGESHVELREALNELLGRRVAAGLYPDWLYDRDVVVSAVVPDDDGVPRCGIY